METDDHNPDKVSNQKEYGNILDFVALSGSPEEYFIEIAVQDDGRAALFYNRPFRVPIAWVEFDMTDKRLNFITEAGDTRRFGIPVAEKITKNLQNTHQILMILIDNETGEAEEGGYVPIILHQH